MVLEFRYKDDNFWYGRDTHLHKIHPNLEINLSKEDIWSNEHISLVGENVFNLDTDGKNCRLNSNEIDKITMGKRLDEKRIKDIKDIKIDTCIIWGPPSNSPKIWKYDDDDDVEEKSIWVDLNNYKRYRKMIHKKFDPQSNRDHSLMEDIDKMIRPIERNILINEIIR
jgi:hypothetical protein